MSDFLSFEIFTTRLIILHDVELFLKMHLFIYSFEEVAARDGERELPSAFCLARCLPQLRLAWCTAESRSHSRSPVWVTGVQILVSTSAAYRALWKAAGLEVEQPGVQLAPI